MNLQEKISAKAAELAKAREQLEEIVKSDDQSHMVETTKSVEALAAELDQLKSAEAAIKKTFVEAPAVVKADPTKGMKKEDAAELLVKSATAQLIGFQRRTQVDQIVAELYKGDEMVRNVAIVTKAANAHAVDPAQTGVAGWAQELTRQAYAGFIDLLRDTSVIPAFPFGQNYQFDGYASIYMPTRSGSANDLAGAFRAEGAPIPVKKLALSSKKLSPKSLGVISHFTNEMLERSTPNIEQIVRAAMLADTAEALDAAFLGTAAATATVPAGLQALAVAADKNPSSGTDVDKIHGDLSLMVRRLAGHRMGSVAGTRWIMNPAQFYTLKLARNAMGVALYPETAAGNLMGFPVIVSTNVPAGVVFLVDGSQVGFAGGAPRFAVSTEAVLHEDSTTPLPIVDNAATAVTAQPVRSLFQTYCTALRCVWELDWDTVRDGSIQVLTGCTW